MTYLKIKPKYEGVRRKDNSTLVANELYTQKEFEKYSVKPFMADTVEVKKNRTIYIFGARFEIAEQR